jgi:hypothetical protein
LWVKLWHPSCTIWHWLPQTGLLSDSTERERYAAVRESEGM